jgi:hypothetical protein
VFYAEPSPKLSASNVNRILLSTIDKMALYSTSELVTIPFQVLKPQSRHEEWFLVRLSPYQPDKKRYVILDGENEILTVAISSSEKNRIELSVKLIGCQVECLKSENEAYEIHIQWSELAPVPVTSSYTSLTAYDGSRREFVLVTAYSREVSL